MIWSNEIAEVVINLVLIIVSSIELIINKGDIVFFRGIVKSGIHGRIFENLPSQIRPSQNFYVQPLATNSDNDKKSFSIVVTDGRFETSHFSSEWTSTTTRSSNVARFGFSTES